VGKGKGRSYLYPIKTSEAMSEFSLEGRDYIALNDLLKITGMCESGGAAKAMVAAGKVKVDGQIELRKTCKIRSGQLVEYAGQQIAVKTEHSQSVSSNG
jgi:ribosome-associated protein